MRFNNVERYLCFSKMCRIISKNLLHPYFLLATPASTLLIFGLVEDAPHFVLLNPHQVRGVELSVAVLAVSLLEVIVEGFVGAMQVKANICLIYLADEVQLCDF